MDELERTNSNATALRSFREGEHRAMTSRLRTHIVFLKSIWPNSVEAGVSPAERVAADTPAATAVLMPPWGAGFQPVGPPAFQQSQMGSNRAIAAFTFVEMLMTLASSSIVLTALISGGVALQRSFAAVEGYSIAEGDQLRVSDYISMDVRRALTASVDNNNVLTITIPNYYDINNANPKWSNAHALAPSFDANGAIQYGTGTTTIKYYHLASNFIREVNGTPNTIATT